MRDNQLPGDIAGLLHNRLAMREQLLRLGKIGRPATADTAPGNKIEVAFEIAPATCMCKLHAILIDSFYLLGLAFILLDPGPEDHGQTFKISIITTACQLQRLGQIFPGLSPLALKMVEKPDPG